MNVTNVGHRDLHNFLLDLLKDQVSKQIAGGNQDNLQLIEGTIKKVREVGSVLFRRFPEFLKFNEEQILSPLENRVKTNSLKHNDLKKIAYFKTHSIALLKVFIQPPLSKETQSKSLSKIQAEVQLLRDAYEAPCKALFDEPISELKFSQAMALTVKESTEKSKSVEEETIEFALAIPNFFQRATALKNIVTRLVEENRFNEAIRCFGEIIDIKSSSNSFNIIVEKLFEQGKWEEAKKLDLSLLMTNEESQQIILFNIADHYLKKDKLNEAILLLPQFHGGFADTFLGMLAKKFIKLGDFSKAKEYGSQISSIWTRAGIMHQFIESLMECKCVYAIPRDYFKGPLCEGVLKEAETIACTIPKTTDLVQKHDLRDFLEWIDYREKALTILIHYYLDQKNYRKAEELIRHVPAHSDVRIASAVKRVVDNYLRKNEATLESTPKIISFVLSRKNDSIRAQNLNDISLAMRNSMLEGISLVESIESKAERQFFITKNIDDLQRRKLSVPWEYILETLDADPNEALHWCEYMSLENVGQLIYYGAKPSADSFPKIFERTQLAPQGWGSFTQRIRGWINVQEIVLPPLDLSRVTIISTTLTQIPKSIRDLILSYTSTNSVNRTQLYNRCRAFEAQEREQKLAKESKGSCILS